MYRLVPPIAARKAIVEGILLDRPTTLTAAFVCTVNKPGGYGDGQGGYESPAGLFWGVSVAAVLGWGQGPSAVMGATCTPSGRR